MTTVLLVRHGLTALTGKLLLGWTPGVGLDERGLAQAKAVAGRLAKVPLDAVVSSPLDRCAQTAGEIAAVGPDGAARPTVALDDRIGECHYGDWTGQELAVLAKDPLWKVVQAHPSAVTFPGPKGEALRDTQARGVAAVRDWNARLGPDATWLLCSHGDVIRAIVTDALGMHLDMYHRINVDPCSLTVIRYTETRPFVLRVNDLGGTVDDLLPKPKEAAAQGEAVTEAAEGEASESVVGGGAGVFTPA
ncbi:MSMEG_4193 family putative phosphomutase [Frankia sp. AgB1.9]|uniref:MSMEG_4193 family putative phosphomutase n=1 Tax=unclassified Frankia TaxID=2632575 RepID=UPI00193325C6|nr:MULTISPECIES: MSMEG_4193 family putative phosphomutase [unclassified Frankia]MBL7491439.1 MSMEG_4193 family putative phosphomutase [Frankia sp. AgW1.1]MBL7552950.1 MSMEG_4193 family putative phosphomutase [Frankia sp. AgB1.9]MBL7617967.1 MSMEG_4193 family putative phosphomutase [Frankia sp. AgB1.8]